MKKRKIGNALLAFTAAAMVLTVNVGSTDAYFTTYVEAQGSKTVHLGGETEIEEIVSSWTKKISIKNKEESNEPVYIRVKAFCGDAYGLQYIDADNKWLRLGPAATDPNVADDDVYYLYKEAVPVGESTTQLQIKIDAKGTKKTFDVVVIYESIPVPYDDEGNAIPPFITENGVEKANPDVWNREWKAIVTKPAGESSVNTESNNGGGTDG